LEFLQQQFASLYPNALEQGVCRAPGRVNLIGEHTDYNGLPVLPIAVDREIRIAFGPRNDHLVCLANTDSAFNPIEFANCGDIPPSSPGCWSNYCRAAIQGLNTQFEITDWPGMNLLVSGTIPAAAGLSSSSAFVVASALAYLAILGRTPGEDISRSDLAFLLAEAETYVGTRGGAMDQTVVLLGRKGMACKIDFFPIQVEYAPLFQDYAFVVCNSLVKANKSGDALHRYNEGPRCCQLITALVNKHLADEFGEDVRIRRLGDLWRGHLCLSDKEAEALFAEAIPDERTTLRHAATRLGITESDIRNKWLGDLPEPTGGFALKARLRHQLTEHRRVEYARDALLAQSPEHFGQLMNESHASCAEDYCISCPELDALTATAREAGAIGARLTGAGFGGCTVNLVPVDKLKDFAEQLDKSYYLARWPKTALPPREQRILTVSACDGATYLSDT